MAIDYKQRYPDQVDTDSAYPQGKARNKTTPVSTDGTPFEKITSTTNGVSFRHC